MVMVETSVKSGFMEVPQQPGRGRKSERSPFARLEAGAPPDQGSTGQGVKPRNEREGFHRPFIPTRLEHIARKLERQAPRTEGTDIDQRVPGTDLKYSS